MVVSLVGVLLLGAPLLAAAGAASPAAPAVVASGPSAAIAVTGPRQQLGSRPWPEDWFSDLPAVDMTGEWVFNPDVSDPMLSTWQGRVVKYRISQQAAFILLEFLVEGSTSNTQRYSWNGTIQRFERGGRQVEEAARWTDAGRTLEIAGRHWDPTEPEERVEYRFAYRMDGDRLEFVQSDEQGETVWRFDRVRGGAPAP